MTITLAQWVQHWFTTRMPTQTRTSESIYEKADRINVDPTRVIAVLDNAPHAWIGIVKGDHKTYRVWSLSSVTYEEIVNQAGGYLGCDCRAGRRGVLCSHAIVAEKRRKGET
jgi:hypothetical protein